MADEDQQAVDTSDEVRHASDDARQAAKERMQAALEAQKRGEEIVVDQASLESSREDAEVSGASSTEKREAPKGDKTLSSVKIYSPFHVYYDGDANSVSAENLTGPFDVLYGHKNFMSLLIPSDIVVRSSRGEEKISIERGVMHVRDNKVTIFLDV
jgi:F0F1-type ATP synthase epsilon subunit